MKSFFRTLAFAVLALCVAVSFAACNTGLPQAPEQPIDVDIDKNVQADLVAVVDNDGVEKMIVEELAEEFCKEYPNVTVDVVQNADVISYIRSGEAVDLVSVIGENVSYYASQDILTPLDDYMEAQKFDESKYYSSMLELGRDSVTDKMYMMPRDYSRITCFYNKALFDKCGVAYPVDTPEDPWTWDKFVATCRALKSSPEFPSNYVPVQAAMSYDILNWGIVSSYGAESILKDDFTLADANSETYKQWQKGMLTAADMITEKYSLDSRLYKATDFENGAAAMSFAVGAASTTYKQKGIDYNVVPFPAIGDTPKTPTGTCGYAIAKNSYNKNVTWAFLNFIMSEAGQKIISEKGQLIPVLKSLAEDESSQWRKMTNGKGNAVDTAQFIKHTERDVTATWFGKLPALARNAYGGFYKKFLTSVCDGNKSFAQAHTVLKGQIEEYKSNYPEYFV